MVMIGFNILISLSATGTFNYYVNGNQELVHDVALQGVMDVSADMSRQLERAVLNQNNIMLDIADYIEAMALKEEETKVYLEYMPYLDGFFLLVDPSTYQGYDFVEKGTFGEKKRQYRSFENIAAIREACEDCLTQEKEFRITPVFHCILQNAGNRW